jgi:hypothetical protein
MKETHSILRLQIKKPMEDRMTIRTATGAYALINFPYGWTPAGQPHNGDTFIVNSDTAIMLGGNFSASTVDLSWNPGTSSVPQSPGPTLDLYGVTHLGTVEVSGPSALAPATINVLGSATIDHLDLQAGYPGHTLTVNSGSFSRLTTEYDGAGDRYAFLNVTGGVGSTLDNDGKSYVDAATIAANVIGNGSWTENGGYPGSVHMSFEGSVGPGQTVNLAGDSALSIDEPTGFHGLVNIEQGWVGGPPDDILLAGIHGDSFTYRNDMLAVSSAGKVVDTLRITDPNGVFSVSDTTAGTMIIPVFSPEVQQYAGSILHVS